ncbi:DUF732 domain-containing protein [Mycobacterium intracellulare]
MTRPHAPPASRAHADEAIGAAHAVCAEFDQGQPASKSAIYYSSSP